GLFFQEDVGSRLLELSLEQARGRGRREPAARPARRTVPQAARPRVLSEPDEAPADLPVEGPANLPLHRLKRESETVFQTPGGVIIRTAKHQGKWRVAELVFD